MGKKYQLEDVVIFLVAMVGVCLAIGQFLYNRSLWLDEAILAVNIVNKSNLALLYPLDYYAVAPILFLQVVKVCSQIIPDSEIGLRLFPLTAFLLSLFFFYRIVTIVYCNKYTIILCISLFVFNPPLIYYASELKQYMGDVLLITVIYYLILEEFKNESHRFYYLGGAGVIGVFLSNVAPIVLLTAGIFLIYKYLMGEKKYFRQLITTSMLWGLSFLVYFYFFIYNHPSREAMVNYWSPLYTFAPRNPFSPHLYKFLWDKSRMITTSLFQFGEQGKWLISILAALGIVALVRKKSIDYIILILVPLIVHLFLSSFKLYPFISD